MQSFHHSRGRILFEVFCAFAIAESCVGAWQQTGAWALLPAAVVAALYGVVHAFDMVGRRPAVAAHPQRVAAAAEKEIDSPAIQEVFVPQPPASAELQLTADIRVEEVEKADPAPPKPTRARRAKAATKASRRRATAPEEVVASEITPAEESRVAEVAPIEEPTVPEFTPREEANVTKLPTAEEQPPEAPVPPEETSPIPLTPLFEPKPFVRLQRAGFGRKA